MTRRNPLRYQQLINEFLSSEDLTPSIRIIYESILEIFVSWLCPQFQTVTVAAALAYYEATLSGFDTYLKEKGLEKTSINICIYVSDKFLEWHRTEKCR